MKRKSFLAVLLAVCLLCGCAAGNTDKEAEPKGKNYDLGGKTYYNTVNEYGNEDHSWIRFESDGTFAMIDNVESGHYEINGHWSVKNGICTLKIGEEGNPNTTTKNAFEIKNENTLVLKTTLGGSKAEQTFSTSKSGWSTYTQDDIKNGTVPGESEGGSTSASAVPCTSIETEYGSYWAKAGTKPWNLDVKVEPKNTTDKITYKSNDESVVKVDEEGNVSAVGAGQTTIEIDCGKQHLSIKFETR